MEQPTNIPLITGKYYMFNYNGQTKNLSFRVRDGEGLHFDDPDLDDPSINWDFIIPPEDIPNIIFEDSMDGYTTTESYSDDDTDIDFEGGKKHNKKIKTKKKKITNKKKTRKNKIKISIMQKQKDNRKNKITKKHKLNKKYSSKSYKR